MKKLVVFDFDDTLFESGASVIVTDKNGVERKLTSAEYATYVPQSDDTFDYKEFDEYPSNPEPITHTVVAFEDAVREVGASNVVILTARANAKPIRDVLIDFDLPAVHIEAVGDANPRLKARYIVDRILYHDYDEVVVFEDSRPNIRTIKKAVDALGGIKLYTYRVTDARTHVLEQQSYNNPASLRMRLASRRSIRLF